MYLFCLSAVYVSGFSSAFIDQRCSGLQSGWVGVKCVKGQLMMKDEDKIE